VRPSRRDGPARTLPRRVHHRPNTTRPRYPPHRTRETHRCQGEEERRKIRNDTTFASPSAGASPRSRRHHRPLVPSSAAGSHRRRPRGSHVQTPFRLLPPCHRHGAVGSTFSLPSPVASHCSIRGVPATPITRAQRWWSTARPYHRQQSPGDSLPHPQHSSLPQGKRRSPFRRPNLPFPLLPRTHALPLWE
jgi:hypothetical protein